MYTFAERLRELRSDAKISIDELSKKVCISVGSISRWENDKADIKSKQLIILAKFFKVSTDYLLGIED